MAEINFNVGNKVNLNDDILTDDGSKKSYKSTNMVFKRVKLKPLTEEEMKKLEKELVYVIVQDYNDDYNLSEEERKEKNKYYEVFSKFFRCKKKYKKLSEYIKAMRLALDCVEVVALNNGVYNPKEFSKKVLKGKIKINGLSFPKYIGKDKKYINYNYLWEIILDKDRDPNEYEGENTDDNDDIYTVEYNENISYDESLPTIHYVDSYSTSDNNIVEELDDDESKIFFKLHPEIISSVVRNAKYNKKRESERNRAYAMAYDLTDTDFKYISDLDTKRKLNSKNGIPKFKGDILDDKAYNKYLKELDDYEENNIKYNYEGEMKTQAQIDEINLKNELEKAGWNLRKMWGNDLTKKKLMQAYKKQRQKEKKLKEQLLKAQAEKRKLKNKRKKR